MLITIFKLWMFFCVKFSWWVVVPILKVVYKLTWKGTFPDLVQAFFEDNQITTLASDAGMLHILLAYKEQSMRMAEAAEQRARGVTREDGEWGEWITNYGENPQPDMIREYFKYLERRRWSPRQELPAWASVQALGSICPDVCDEFSGLYTELQKLAIDAPEDRPGWNDYYMGRWFILREDRDAQTIAERTKLPGMVGATCTWMANSVSQQIPAFREALERAGYSFPDVRQTMGEKITAEALENTPATPGGEIILPEGAPTIYPMSIAAADSLAGKLQGGSIVYAKVEKRDDVEQVVITTTAGQIIVRTEDLGIAFHDMLREEPKC